MKTLLTGGAGYIGSHTAVAMIDAGHEVAVVDNYANSSAEAIARVEKITGKKSRKSSTSNTGRIIKNATSAATRTITRDILGNMK